MPSDDHRRTPPLSEQPDGSLTGTMFLYHRRLAAAGSHAAAEGADVPPQAVLEGYDRALHPISRHLRPPALKRRIRRWLP